MNLATQVGAEYDAGKIEKDVKRLWETGRFDDIHVETEERGESTAIIFQVVEAPEMKLRRVLIEPTSYGLTPKVQEGAPLTRFRAHEIAMQAQRQLVSQGYLDAKVDYALEPDGGRWVDLRLKVIASDAVRAKGVEITGNTGLDPAELRGALQALRARRIIPAIPGVWHGWRMLPAYSPEAVDSDLARLRSLYFSKGYFQPVVRLDSADVHGPDARVSIRADSGPRYQIRRFTLPGAPDLVGPRVADVCSCLMARRREAERLGILDFSVRLNLQPAGAAPGVDMTASIERGKPYRLGRIEFIGLQKQKDATARRAFLLDEGDLLDMTLLRRSVMRLDRTNLFEPVGEHDVMIRQNERTGLADVSIRLVERKRGSWALSGPVGPASMAGPFQASISSRLPAWGAGLLDLSTYTASISLFAFARPLLPLLGLKSPFAPIFALQRPFTPSEGWKSGFLLAPQMGWRASLLSYPVTQIQQRLLPVLAGNRDQTPDLPVTVAGPDGEMTTFCEPAKPGLRWLRRGAMFGVQFAGTLASFY